MKNQNQAKGMKFKLLTIGLILITFGAKAQFTGPVSNVLNTSNQVNINTFVTAPCYGTLPTNPLLYISLTQCTNSGNVNQDIFKANWNSVEVFQPLFAKQGLKSSGNIDIFSNSTTKAIELNSVGLLKINTDGIWPASRGLTITNPTTTFFNITEEQILFKNATQDLFKVDANGYVYARKAIVTLTNPYPDYVFDKNYKLKTLTELEAFIAKYHHLPNVPSLAEVEANNKQIDVGEMQVILLEKVEELTLYILQQQKEIEALKAKLAE